MMSSAITRICNYGNQTIVINDLTFNEVKNCTEIAAKNIYMDNLESDVLEWNEQ